MKKDFCKRGLAVLVAGTMIVPFGNLVEGAEAQSVNGAAQTAVEAAKTIMAEVQTEQETTEADLKWELVWSDEFDGDKLDETKWSYQIGNGYNGWGNYEKQYYTEDNVTVSDGTLKITAKKESISGYEYTSSRIRTVTDDGQTLFSTKYGKIEARIKLPEGTGLWPAFWMMPVDNEYGSWPLSGEIDIMEARGRVLDTVNGTIHFGESRPFNKSIGGSYSFTDDTDITDYHVYGIEWSENEIIWLVDGVEYYRTSNWYTMTDGVAAEYPAPFNEEFYIILNMAVGGNYDSYQTPSDADLPGTMEVDYVRVYHDKNGYSDSNIQMPEGTRDEAAMESIATYENGSLLSDINFETINEEIMYSDEADYSTHNWFFVNNRYFYGDAVLSKSTIESSEYVNVHLTNPGSETYSVQLKQLLPLAKGYVYKVAFQAKCAEGTRTIKVKPVAGEALGHLNYNDSYVANLTTDMQTFEFSFIMTEETDLEAVLEFNVGKKDGDVTIGNVTATVMDTYILPEDDSVTDDEDVTAGEDITDREEVTDKEEITDKEEVTPETKEIIQGAVENGDFSQGISVWNVVGTYYALEEKNGNVYGKVYTKQKENPWDRMWYQSGIYLTEGETYTVEFMAKSSADNQKFAVTVEDNAYVKSLYKEFTVGKEWEVFSYTFTAGTDEELSLKYFLGMVDTDCKLYLDDVSITVNN